MTDIQNKNKFHDPFENSKISRLLSSLNKKQDFNQNLNPHLPTELDEEIPLPSESKIEQEFDAQGYNQVTMGNIGYGKSYYQKHRMVKESMKPTYLVSCPCGKTQKFGFQRFSDSDFRVIETRPWILQCPDCETQRFGTTAEPSPEIEKIRTGIQSRLVK